MPLEGASETFYDLPEDVGTTHARSGFASFKASRFASVRPLLVEAPFELELDAGRLAGRIDAVYATDDTWEIVDFKSGVARPGQGRHVQLEAYAVAVQEAGFPGGPPAHSKVTFAYFGDGLEEITEDVDSTWLADAGAHLDSLMAGAAGDDHPATPSDACRSCDFTSFCDDGTDWLAANR